MKKIILTVAAVLAFGFANAQDGQFKAGVHVGLPMGDIKDVSSINLGADVAYLWNVADEFKVGVTTGYTSYSGKDVTFSDGFNSFTIKSEAVGFIPVAATAQYSLTDNLFLGADLGYGIYTGKGESDGGVYYQPKFGYQNEKIELYAGYKGISVDGGSFSSLNLGFNYKF